MHPDLVKLLDLQEKDVALLEVDARLAEVLAELEALDRDSNAAARSVEQARKSAADAVKRREEIEARIDNYRKLIDRQQGRTEQLKGQREIAAAMTEMDLARGLLTKEEGEWARVGDSAIGFDQAVKTAEQRQEELRSAQTEQRATLDARRATIESERDKVAELRQQSAAAVDRALRQRYDRLRTARTARSRQVVVALVGAACGNCFTQVPMNRRSQIRAGTLIDWCESCGVILYYADASE